MSDRIYDIPWKQTVYNGTMYDSVLEVRWTRFLTELGIIHSYHPRVFTFPEFYGQPELYTYEIDYGLTHDVPYDFIEIKPTPPTANEYSKVRALSQRGYKVAIFAGGCNPDVQVYLFEFGHRKYIPRTSVFLQQCFQFKLTGKQGETVAALKVVLGKKGNLTKAFEAAWEWKA